jgi:hypothetical protein
MSSIAAAELKRKGVSALSSILGDEQEAVITVRGKAQYVVMTMDGYHRLRESELAQAVREARADYEAGRVADKTVEQHVARLRRNV